MNYDARILNHSTWQMRLKTPSWHRRYRPAAGNHRHCEWGKWPHGEGKQHAGGKEYEDLKAKHARFHALVPPIVQHAQVGRVP